MHALQRFQPQLADWHVRGRVRRRLRTAQTPSPPHCEHLQLCTFNQYCRSLTFGMCDDGHQTCATCSGSLVAECLSCADRFLQETACVDNTGLYHNFTTARCNHCPRQMQRVHVAGVVHRITQLELVTFVPEDIRSMRPKEAAVQGGMSGAAAMQEPYKV